MLLFINTNDKALDLTFVEVWKGLVQKLAHILPNVLLIVWELNFGPIEQGHGNLARVNDLQEKKSLVDTTTYVTNDRCKLSLIKESESKQVHAGKQENLGI